MASALRDTAIAVSAILAEVARRDAGLEPDERFDVPIAMLLDLRDELNESVD